jgi:hypothetical protein
MASAQASASPGSRYTALVVVPDEKVPAQRKPRNDSLRITVATTFMHAAVTNQAVLYAGHALGFSD